MVEDDKEKQTDSSQDKPQDSGSDSQDGISSQEGSPILREAAVLEKTAENFRIQNEKREKILEREERIMARKEALQALGGDSLADGKTKELTPEEKKKAEAKEFWKGTGIDKAIDKHG